MEPVRLRKLLGQVCDAIASNITPTAHHAGWLATLAPQIVWSDRPRQSDNICQHHGLTRTQVCPYSC